MLTSTSLTLPVVPAWYSLNDEWVEKLKQKR
jgi:hypothetical protein